LIAADDFEGVLLDALGSFVAYIGAADSRTESMVVAPLVILNYLKVKRSFRPGSLVADDVLGTNPRYTNEFPALVSRRFRFVT